MSPLEFILRFHFGKMKFGHDIEIIVIQLSKEHALYTIILCTLPRLYVVVNSIAIAVHDLDGLWPVRGSGAFINICTELVISQ